MALYNTPLSTYVKSRFSAVLQAIGVLVNPILTTLMTAQGNVDVKEVPLAALKMATATMDVRTTGGGPRVTNNAIAPREISVRETQDVQV